MQISSELLKQCWFLAGPTAVGKSAISLALAKTLNAEILSLDSMAIYRGMDIGTAKPTALEQEQVPHHLLDLVSPWEEFSVAEYLQLAEQTAQQVLARGRVPLFVGGTGLYLRSVLRGIFNGPPADEAVREQLELRYQTIGDEAFHRELTEIDSLAAAKIHPHDARRLIRAREVFELTGRPFSSFHEEKPLAEENRPKHVYWLLPPRDWLYSRVNLRVDQMLKEGLLEEVQRLTELPEPLSRTARQAIGYKELFDAIAQQTPIEAAVELIKTRSRQLAKRQHTWFRNLEECTPIEITGEETTEEIVDRLLNDG